MQCFFKKGVTLFATSDPKAGAQPKKSKTLSKTLSKAKINSRTKIIG